MDALRALGFKKDWVYETLVTTRSDKKVNAAPMGVWSADGASVSMRVHKTADTYGNIRKNKKFAVNFPGVVALFYDAILEGDKLQTEGDSLFLKDCPAVLEAEVTALEDMEDAVVVTARVLAYRIKKAPQLINRAEYLALDSLIAYTKLSSVPEKERDMLTERIRENLRVIRRTALNSDFQKLVERLLD
jgi:hypothetical protein